MRLVGKTAVITGAGSGIGKAIAERFVREGARIMCADISGAEQDVAAAVGNGAIGLCVDVSVETDIAAMMDTAHDVFGRVDILVNNAGFGDGTKPLHEQTAEDWDRLYASSLRAVFLGMKYGVLAMLDTGGGAIVNIGSATGMVGSKHHSLFAATNSGVSDLTECAALDYATQGIRINAILPGTIAPRLVPIAKDQAGPPRALSRVPGIATDRWVLPSEIADAALYLTSDDASYITGAVLPVDCGRRFGLSGMTPDKFAHASLSRS